MAARKKAPDTLAMFDVPTEEREPRATRLRESWRPTPEEMAKLRADYRDLDIDAELEHFRDYHMAKGSKMVSWYRALRTWLNNQRKWNAKDRRVQAINRANPPKAGLTPAQPFPVYNPGRDLGKEPF